MDGVPATGGGGGGGSSGGPAPFLLKTYEMVDDSSTDEIVSWSSSKNSFVVWNPPEFARLLLPTYFKHNNFSSFIRQLNTYGFRKIDSERWEFGNEDFVKDKKHLLKNIHRRKPIHSHSQPQGSLVDPERAAFDEKIAQLSLEKSELEKNVLKFKQHNSTTKMQLEELSQRIGGMEQKQNNVLTYLDKAIKNPIFIENLAHKIESMDLSTYNKKRRLPQVDKSQPMVENSFLDDHSKTRPEYGHLFQQDFSSKLKLELSPAVSDINMVCYSTQSSNEDEESPQRRISENDPKNVNMGRAILELSDTGTSFTFNMDHSVVSLKSGANESPRFNSSQQSLATSEEGEGNISCQLNLSLASSTLRFDKSHSSIAREAVNVTEFRSTVNNGKEADLREFSKNINTTDENGSVSSSHDEQVNNDNNSGHGNNNNNNQGHRSYNDVFWEQFLTERPGTSDTEEASSNFRANPYDDQEERSGQRMSRNSLDMEQLTL